jgi:hypothetical protein
MQKPVSKPDSLGMESNGSKFQQQIHLMWAKIIELEGTENLTCCNIQTLHTLLLVLHYMYIHMGHI